MEKILGIDLGTGNSACAFIEGDRAQIIPAADTGAQTTPSMVAFTKSGDVLVGAPAARQRVTNSKNTVYSIKRFMGRRFSEVQPEVEMAPYKVVAGQDGSCRVDIDGKLYSPEEISAKILEKLKKDAEAFLGEKVKKCVITCPAYFDAAAKEATKNAGTIAGMEVVRVVSEPTAACLAYGLDKKKTGKIAIADIGCGTSDFSIIDIADGVFEVLAINGDNHLGGWDFNNAVAQWLISEFKEKTGVDLSADPMAMQRINEEAEKAKCALSTSLTYSISLPFISMNASGPLHLETELSRAKLEALVEPLVSRLAKPVTEVLKDAGCRVDEVVLVGGSCRMPLIQRKIAELFGTEPSKNANLDTVVAEGAAIQGGVLNGQDIGSDVLLLDVTPLDIGIETLGGVFTPLIEKNSTIPCKRSQVFTTAADNQSAVTVQIATGNRPMFVDNKLIGTFNLDGIPPAARGVPQIEITVDVDANNIVNVSAKDLSTGKEQHITITNGSGLSKDEIERMKNEAASNAEEDRRKSELAQAKNNAESLCFSSEKAVSGFGDKITDAERNSVLDAVKALRTAVAGADISEIKAKTADLEKANEAVSRKVYGSQASSPFGKNGLTPEQAEKFAKEHPEMFGKNGPFGDIFGKFGNGPIDPEVMN